MSNDDEIARLQKRHDRIVQVAANVPVTALASAAEPIVAEMKRQAPVLPAATDERQPGELRDSIVATPGGQVTPQGRTVPLNAVVISAGSDQVPYAAYVEFGTSKAPAEPFFYPTIRLMAQRTQQALLGAWRKAVDNAWADE